MNALARLCPRVAVAEADLAPHLRSLRLLSTSLQGKYSYRILFNFANVINRTYVVSSPITTYYYTEMVGDARKPPTLLATAGFSGIAVIGESSPKNLYDSY